MKKKDNIKNHKITIINFFKFVLKLKGVYRQGWKNELNIIKPESVAEHCYSMAVLAMILSDLENLNTLKIIKMTLLHDLAESEIGDFTPNDINHTNKKKLEDHTMKKILNKLPKKLYIEYLKLWNEYKNNKTDESKFIKKLDKLELIFQAKSYSHNIKTFLNYTNKL